MAVTEHLDPVPLQRRERVIVLEADRGLCEVVDPGRAGRARAASLAAAAARRAGSWDAGGGGAPGGGGFGLLVLEGVLVRRVGVEGRFGAELLATGDLLRPWQHDGEAGGLAVEVGWGTVTTRGCAV